MDEFGDDDGSLDFPVLGAGGGSGSSFLTVGSNALQPATITSPNVRVLPSFGSVPPNIIQFPNGTGSTSSPLSFNVVRANPIITAPSQITMFNGSTLPAFGASPNIGMAETFGIPFGFPLTLNTSWSPPPVTPNVGIIPSRLNYIDTGVSCVPSNLLSQYLSSAGLRIEGNPSNSSSQDDDVEITFYRGNTYYDLLRTHDEPIDDVIQILSDRQSGRDIDQGVFYTSINRDVALYFAFLETGNRPGQGGAGIMTINLPYSDFQRIRLAYGVMHNNPVAGLPPQIPQPHVETRFPFPALADLFLVSQISVELIPT